MSELSGFGQKVAVTPQSEQADPRQKANNAGGFSFTLDHWDHLTRFLVLGTAGGTYYAGQKAHTKQGIEVLNKCLDLDGVRAVNLAVEISEAGRAIKNDQAIFLIAVASAHKDLHVRQAAFAALPKVCRTATHLFQYLDFVQEYRGWGRGLRLAVSNWFTGKDPQALAYQMVKYRSRDGWTHMDALRLSHPDAKGELHRIAFDFACGREHEGEKELRMIAGYREAQKSDVDQAAVIREYKGLPWEALQTPIAPEAWKALIYTDSLPLHALKRQLPTLTNAKVFEDNEILKKVLGNLTNQEYILRSRLHPFDILVSLMTYKSGKNFRGGNTWTPNTAIIDALDKAFYLSFGNVEPMGGNTMLAIDISASMTWVNIANTNIDPRGGASAMAMITQKTEEPGSVTTTVFSSGGRQWRADGVDGIQEVNISSRQRLDDVVKEINRQPAGGTDCSLPMVWAKAQGRSFDQFVVYTDSETWAGRVHPHQALRDYRKAVNPNAKLIVVGMTATEFTIADPSDAGMLDVVGFDAAAPGLMSSFARGEI